MLLFIYHLHNQDHCLDTLEKPHHHTSSCSIAIQSNYHKKHLLLHFQDIDILGHHNKLFHFYMHRDVFSDTISDLYIRKDKCDKCVSVILDHSSMELCVPSKLGFGGFLGLTPTTGLSTTSTLEPSSQICSQEMCESILNG